MGEKDDPEVKTQTNKLARIGKLGLILALGAELFAACSAEAPHEMPVTAPTMNVPVTLSVSTAVGDGQQPLALDYVVRRTGEGADTIANPYLDRRPFQSGQGVKVNLLFVCTSDSRQPVSRVSVTLYPTVSSTGVITLKTPTAGGQVELAEGTNLRQGTWRVAMYYGDIATDGAAEVDPNNLSAVAYSSDVESDTGIDNRWKADRYNLRSLKSHSPESGASGAESVSLSVPYLTDWVTIGASNFWTTESGESRLTIPPMRLRPQGILLRLITDTRINKSSSFQLSGFRLLTNSLSFRGGYDFSDAMLRANAASSDLSALYSAQNMNGGAYADSLDQSLAFPNYADFWLSKAQSPTSVRNRNSDYFLIWAMPRPDADDATQSREGYLHVLAYDRSRNFDSYEKTLTSNGRRMIPKGLVRKPLLTRYLQRGDLRLSSGRLSGRFYRLQGVNTDLQPFPQYLSSDVTSLSQSSAFMQPVTIPRMMHVATRANGNIIYSPDEYKPLGVSTYTEGVRHFALVGWGEGQTYLSAYVYTSSSAGRTSVRGRYLGPAFHRPYAEVDWTSTDPRLVWGLWSISSPTSSLPTLEQYDKGSSF